MSYAPQRQWAIICTCRCWTWPKRHSNFFTRKWFLETLMAADGQWTSSQHTVAAQIATKAWSNFCTRNWFLRPWKLQIEMETCQHTWPLKMATKAWSNFCTRSFLKHWKLHLEMDGVLPISAPGRSWHWKLAAQNGHEGVLQFLHQVVPETLKTAAGNGMLPAHWAAINGHEGVIRFLHQVVPETLKAADGNGELPDWPVKMATKACQHISCRCIWNGWPRRRGPISAPGRSWNLENCIWIMETLPAHLAATNGHEGVIQFLHQVVPWDLENCSTLGAKNGHGVLQFLHQHIGPLGWNGHEGVIQFLHQVVPETLKTADANGKLPADLAVLQDESAENGQWQWVLKFLHQVVKETLTGCR